MTPALIVYLAAVKKKTARIAKQFASNLPKGITN
jgi:hypothetical protein